MMIHILANPATQSYRALPTPGWQPAAPEHQIVIVALVESKNITRDVFAEGDKNE